ncbi:MAG: flagellar motor switch protein FliN [Deltaproteobacteria bacterium]|nr:MAG: flagellar motor switch protein FliN [Deltaproteobacteria bacterium]
MNQTIAKEKIKDILKNVAEHEVASPNISLILDIPLRITVELGRTRMTIKELLRLGEGSIIELPVPAGDPLDILVNQKPIAKGEVVIVNEKYGVRILSIISEKERLEQLK